MPPTRLPAPPPTPGSIPDPSLTCPRRRDNFGLAAGTIPLGGVGGDGNGVGSLWGQAADGGFLRRRRGSFPSPRSKEARPCQPPQDLSWQGVSGAHGARGPGGGGAVQGWTLPDAGQAGGMCAQEDPARPRSCTPGADSSLFLSGKNKGYTVPLLHCAANDTSRRLCTGDTRGEHLARLPARMCTQPTAPV